MTEELNKKMLFDNISYLIKKEGIKIGELESAAGVSPGYISRTSKDGGTKPGIDFIMKAAIALNVSIDTLLRVDMKSLTPTEQYLISFLEKLNIDTIHDKLTWNCESEEYLNYRLEADGYGRSNHPLFSQETFLEPGEEGYPNEVTRIVFISKSFDVHTCIHGDCYNLRMKNGVFLYLMNICRNVHRIGDPTAFAKEIWICPTGECGKQYLCSTGDLTRISDLINELYESVSENTKHPKVNKIIRDVIDSFMRDDMEDDEGFEQLPF